MIINVSKRYFSVILLIHLCMDINGTFEVVSFYLSHFSYANVLRTIKRTLACETLTVREICI